MRREKKRLIAALAVAALGWITWSGKGVISLSPPPLKTGRTSRPVPGLSRGPAFPALRLLTTVWFPRLRLPNGHLPLPLDSRTLSVPLVPPPGHVSTFLGDAIRRYPAGYDFPRAFRLPAFASWPSCPAGAWAIPCG